jgi:hypothetical protein
MRFHTGNLTRSRRRFPIQPSVASNTISDDTSMLSSGISASQSSAFGSSLHITHSMRQRHRLSPVSEGLTERKEKGDSNREGSENDVAKSARPPPPGPRRLNRNYFSISPPEKVDARPAGAPLTFTTNSSTMYAASNDGITTSDHLQTPITPRYAEISPVSPLESVFAKRPIVKPMLQSALTTMLSAPDAVSNNPFNELYAATSGRAETASMEVRVFFPHSPTAAVNPVTMRVRKDASVEEVVGFGLWTYWDRGIEPKLDEGLGGEEDPRRETVLSAVGWNLRIAEDDGEVDEDFPGAAANGGAVLFESPRPLTTFRIALDRTRPISKFSFDSFAICAATPTQGESTLTTMRKSKLIPNPNQSSRTRRWKAR